jgi:HTH-type transcriptional regulator/antitoxin MqsA
MAGNGVHCPECGTLMKRGVRAKTVAYKDHMTKVKVLGDWCDKCGEAIFEGDSLGRIERTFNDLRAEVEHVLSPGEVFTIRSSVLHLTQAEAGKLLGGGVRAFQKYESGETAVSQPMTNLLKLLRNDPSRLQELEETNPKGKAKR